MNQNTIYVCNDKQITPIFVEVMSMSIRNAKTSDKFAVKELADHCAPDLRPSVVGTYEFLARCFSNTFFLYEENSKLLGYTVGFPNTAVKGEFWVYQVGVHSDARKKGVGSKLFDRLVNQVRSEGYTRIRSHLKFTNEASKRLHEKYGMNICGQDDRGWFVEGNLQE